MGGDWARGSTSRASRSAATSPPPRSSRSCGDGVRRVVRRSEQLGGDAEQDLEVDRVLVALLEPPAAGGGPEQDAVGGVDLDPTTPEEGERVVVDLAHFAAEGRVHFHVQTQEGEPGAAEDGRVIAALRHEAQV